MDVKFEHMMGREREKYFEHVVTECAKFKVKDDILYGVQGKQVAHIFNVLSYKLLNVYLNGKDSMKLREKERWENRKRSMKRVCSY